MADMSQLEKNVRKIIEWVNKADSIIAKLDISTQTKFEEISNLEKRLYLLEDILNNKITNIDDSQNNIQVISSDLERIKNITSDSSDINDSKQNKNSRRGNTNA